jgi:hypothetical protein
MPVRKLYWTLIAAAAVSVFLFVLAPPAPNRVDATGWSDLASRTVAGAYHVHTTRSDGHGSKAAVAAAAARAGLAFVILTDHGDGTRPPDPAEYVDGVLLVDGVEISTDEGHYVALGMRRSPYPLGGSAGSVVEDVRRLGGFGIAAHPDSAKPALRWTGPTDGIDGIEWLNADSEWRDETRAALVRAGLGYFLRPAPALASLLDRPKTLERWDQLQQQRFATRPRSPRPMAALGATDAHGGPGQRVEDQNRTMFGTIGIPSYEASFRELSIHAVLDGALSGEAPRDADAILRAIRTGRTFTAVDALAAPAVLDFRIRQPGDPSAAELYARATMPPGAQLVLIGQQGEIARSAGDLHRPWPPGPPASWYRVEVRLPGAPGAPPVPWIVSNPLISEWPAAEPVDAGAKTREALPRIPPFPWRIEKDPQSSAILRTVGTSVELDYRLADGPRNSQYVAIATDVHDVAFTAIDFDLASAQPCRLAVQVRTADGRRWGRSYYVAGPADGEPGTLVETRIHADLSSFRPVGQDASGSPNPRDVTSVLLVSDLTNAVPGHRGHVTMLASALSK